MKKIKEETIAVETAEFVKQVNVNDTVNKFHLNLSQNVEPIATVIPKITDKYVSNRWINWNTDNLYPYELLELYYSSGIHSGIIDTKVDLILSDNTIIDTTNELLKQETQDYLDNINAYETSEDLLLKIALDFELFGGFAIKVIWSKDGKYISELHHVNFEQVRCAKKNSMGQVDTYFLCEDWRNRVYFAQVPIVSFNTNSNYNLENPVQLLVYKGNSAKSAYYPMPNYNGGISSIDADVQIKKYYATYLHNNMSPTYLVSHPGIDSAEQAKEFHDSLLNQYTSSANAGKFMLVFGNSPETTPTIETVPDDGKDKKFEVLNTQIQAAICTAHRINPIVAGINTPGALGQRNELLEARAQFKQDFIKKEQKQILRVFNNILRINKLAEIKFEEEKVDNAVTQV